MDSFGKPVTDYPEILKTISAMLFKKSLSINSFVTQNATMQSIHMWLGWSLYISLGSNNLNSVLPQLFLL